MNRFGKSWLAISLMLILFFMFAACDTGEDEEPGEGEIKCHKDTDGDGYGNPQHSVISKHDECPEGWSEDGTDCDDGDADLFAWLDGSEDADHDGYGVGEPDQQVCSGEELPEGYGPEGGDCDDNDPLKHPAAFDFPDDNIDQNCDGVDFERSEEVGIFVSPMGSDQGTGKMDDPLLVLSDAVDLAAAQGKVVFVAEGQYFYDLSVTATVSMFGGYEDASWSRNITLYPSIIPAGSTKPAVRIEGGVGETIVFEGFTVHGDDYALATTGVRVSAGTTAIVANNLIYGGNGGASCNGVSSKGDITLLGNRITGSRGAPTGAVGVYINGGTALLVDNIIEANDALGAVSMDGVQVINAEATLIRNQISGGTGGTSTSSVEVNNSDVTLVNNLLFSGFDCTSVTGVSVTNSQFAALNNVIFANADEDNVTGIKMNTVTAAYLVNNIVDVRSNYWAYGLHLNDSQNVYLLNNDLFVHGEDPLSSGLIYLAGDDLTTLADVEACEWTGCAQAEDNLAEDPAFDLEGTFHLQAGSPCVDAGRDIAPWYFGPWFNIDWDLDDRPQGAGWDMGIDEF
ncbi:MAG: MopE-related protein [Candidatus Lernaella stagnicola]|nr:MopE-related protein [Candidatus Lernaella stagnicola]